MDCASRSCLQCLLDNLLAAKDESGAGMSNQALRDELMTLLIAGQETSAIVLSWTCALLAHNPVQQDRVCEELERELKGKAVTSSNVGYNLCTCLLLMIQ